MDSDPWRGKILVMVEKLRNKCEKNNHAKTLFSQKMIKFLEKVPRYSILFLQQSWID